MPKIDIYHCIVSMICFCRDVKIWDVMILVPNVLFLFYLLAKICRIVAKFRKNDSPMFIVCLMLVRYKFC